MTSQTLRLVTFAALGAMLSAGSLAACSSLPSVSFEGKDGGTEPGGDSSIGADDSGVRDATLPSVDSGVDATREDAPVAVVDAGSDVGADDAGDDGGDDAATMCGSVAVANCAKCPGFPITCKKANPNTCVADCDDCIVGSLPCWKCPNGGPRGTCQAPNAKGVLSCPTGGGNQCTCDAASDCPTAPGSGQVCGALDASASTKCYTCGEMSTNGVACAMADGGAGTCSEGAGPATCQ